jgi:RNA polymerase sigma-70 factor (ECF subfamily)
MSARGQVLATQPWRPATRRGSRGQGEVCVTRGTVERVYGLYRKKVFNLCRRLGGWNDAWAEDATQDVFVKVLENLPQDADAEALGAWIYRITVNTCYTRLKRENSTWRRVRNLLMHSEPQTSSSPERATRVAHDLRAVMEEVDRMPPLQRVVFTMHHLDGLKVVEIADVLSLSKGYVSKLLARTRRRLVRRGWEVLDD